MGIVPKIFGPIPSDQQAELAITQSLTSLDGKINDLGSRLIAEAKEHRPTNEQMKIYRSFKHDLENIHQEISNISAMTLTESQKATLKKTETAVEALEEKLFSPKFRNLAISTFTKNQSIEGVDNKLFEQVAPGLLACIYDKISALIFNGSEREIHSRETFEKELNNIETEIDKLQSAQKSILADLENPREEIMAKLLTPIHQKLIALAEKKAKLLTGNKGLITRESMKQIGGESVKIIDEVSNATLDGMYLSADEFRKTLKNAGGQIANFDFEGKPSQCFSFPAEKFQNSALPKNLGQLGIQEIDFEIFTYDGKTYLYPKNQMNYREKMIGGDVKFSEIDLAKKCEGGTVLLTSGNVGNYEMHKKEMLAYLLRGVNVMGCNFAGYGISEGKPNAATINRNMEAFYQHLKKHHPISDEKIMLKALCMSGGPATYLAAKHPAVNLFLDQTYADFRVAIGDVLESDFISNYLNQVIPGEESKDSLTQLFKNWCKFLIDKVAHFIGELVAPPWETEKEIVKVQGNIGFLYSTEDEYFTYPKFSDLPSAGVYFKFLITKYIRFFE